MILFFFRSTEPAEVLEQGFLDELARVANAAQLGVRDGYAAQGVMAAAAVVLPGVQGNPHAPLERVGGGAVRGLPVQAAGALGGGVQAAAAGMGVAGRGIARGRDRNQNGGRGRGAGNAGAGGRQQRNMIGGQQERL